VATLFNLEGRAGITEVTLGRVSLEAALTPVDVPMPMSNATNPVASIDHLFVLPSGRLPAHPGEFVGTDSVAKVLQRLRRDFDFVLVDAPPAARVGRRHDALHPASMLSSSRFASGSRTAQC